MRAARALAGVAATAAILAANAAAAHEFTAALYMTGEMREARLAEAVNGFLLAADERDGHSDETSDGHLGGVDVQVLPLPVAAAGRVSGLVGTPRNPPGVVVVFGPGPEPADLDPDSVVLRPGALPDSWASPDRSGSFAARYRDAYGVMPTVAAAQGYNAARRLDLAIRPLDGITPRAGLISALGETDSGVDWQEALR
jgi:hypothetical protein